MHAAHGQSGHRAVPFSLHRGICAFRIGNQILHKHAGKRTGAYPAINLHHAVAHHDPHGPHPSLGEQIIHDEVYASLMDPAGFVFTQAMLQIEYGQGPALAVWRAVNQTALSVPCHSGGIIMARHRSVRHILQLIIPVLLGRHVQKVHGTRVSETDRKLGQQYRFPVHEDVHIAESSLQLQRTAPAAILAFFQRPAGTAWQTDRQAGCLRRIQTKTRPSVLFEKYPILRWDQLKCRSLLKTGILPHLQRPPFVKPG